MQWRKERDAYIIRIGLDEAVEESLLIFGQKADVQSGQFWGIGAVKKVVLGYYDLSDKTYLKKEMPGSWELLSLTGTLARTREGPIIHMHGLFSDAEFKTVGGHVFSLTTAATVEIYLVVLKSGLLRSYDEQTGLNLLDL